MGCLQRLGDRDQSKINIGRVCVLEGEVGRKTGSEVLVQLVPPLDEEAKPHRRLHEGDPHVMNHQTLGFDFRPLYDPLSDVLQILALDLLTNGLSKGWSSNGKLGR